MISLLIAASGLLASRTLTRVDHDLGVFYAEYTTAVTDLGRVNGELIRYRTSVIRANEADTRQDYERIVASLPERRAHIDAAIERLVQASNDASLAGSTDARELTELKAVREKLEAYIVSSKHTIQILEQRWRTSSRVEAQQLKSEAERHTAKDEGDKFIGLTLESDRLVEVVAGITGEVKKEADSTLRVATIVPVGVSLVLAALSLAIPAGEGTSRPG